MASAYGPSTPGSAQRVDRLRDGARVGGGVLAERAPRVRRHVGDPGDAGVGPAVEHGTGLDPGDPASGRVELVELGVGRAAFDVVDLGARQRERHADLHQREHPPLPQAHPAGFPAAGWPGHAARPAQVDGGARPGAGGGEVDDASRGQQRGQAFSGLVVDDLPGRVGDRRELAQQVVHDRCPFRLPMPRLPVDPGGEASST